MGMFNWVNFEYECPKCGELVINFQTKSSAADLSMQTVEPQTCHNFYSSCPNEDCDNWIEFTVVPLGGVEFKMLKGSKDQE